MSTISFQSRRVYDKKHSRLQVFYDVLIFFGLSIAFLGTLIPNFAIGQVRFRDNFEGTLSGWKLVGGHAIEIIDSKDKIHGRAMAMQPDGIVYALVKDSEQWGAVRVEGEVLFPTEGHSYLGFIYNYRRDASRTDFGEIYLKGNGSYLRMNPWRDGNVSRLLYEEYKTPLRGDDAIVINKWHKFKVEIQGSMCHYYIGNMSTPQITYSLFEHASGLVGLKPRVVGDPVWVDNIKITSIKRLSYDGPELPQIIYEPDSLVTKWEVIGPLKQPNTAIEWTSDLTKSEIVTDDTTYTWKPFQVDARGAVVTGQVTEYIGNRPVAYFRTLIESERAQNVVLHFSTVDEIAHWVNNRFQGFVYRDGYMSLPHNDWNAWYDFWKNPDHAGRRIPTQLNAGTNQLVIRVRNGQFASGGFFLRLESQ
ncbi:hypothetical protein GWO43_27965 [candidate division KSB1 bacterium]|nr:hypothetical protein [candidate division KSB1 bacterium]NIV69424.1 hypothetical protein [Phycisphaerae bacterium]NIR70722.1 hypothetical protein [candidate division KSB1 bacterium]NIS27779.1 hypothetical protein [candidate division KSB1 bacterium]NIT74627.1 hypothetical protein [candidate division KSB1 bacterium]